MCVFRVVIFIFCSLGESYRVFNRVLASCLVRI